MVASIITVIEVLSPDDRMAQIWECEEAILRRVSFFALPNGKTILLSDVFAWLDHDLNLADRQS